MTLNCLTETAINIGYSCQHLKNKMADILIIDGHTYGDVENQLGNGTAVIHAINEFFEMLEGSATIGNWSETDLKLVCALKLTDTARALYSATPELRDPIISWQDFKARFLQRFRDVRSVQYHFRQLYMARQRKGETAQEFLDRCRLLARRTVPCTTDPVLQQAYYEQAERMLLYAFTNGITGIPGKQLRYNSPATVEEALRIAMTVSQAEIPQIIIDLLIYTLIYGRQCRDGGR